MAARSKLRAPARALNSPPMYTASAPASIAASSASREPAGAKSSGVNIELFLYNSERNYEENKRYRSYGRSKRKWEDMCYEIWEDNWICYDSFICKKVNCSF